MSGSDRKIRVVAEESSRTTSGRMATKNVRVFPNQSATFCKFSNKACNNIDRTVLKNDLVRLNGISSYNAVNARCAFTEETRPFGNEVDVHGVVADEKKDGAEHGRANSVANARDHGVPCEIGTRDKSKDGTNRVNDALNDGKVTVMSRKGDSVHSNGNSSISENRYGGSFYAHDELNRLYLCAETPNTTRETASSFDERMDAKIKERRKKAITASMSKPVTSTGLLGLSERAAAKIADNKVAEEWKSALKKRRTKVEKREAVGAGTTDEVSGDNSAYETHFGKSEHDAGKLCDLRRNNDGSRFAEGLETSFDSRKAIKHRDKSQRNSMPENIMPLIRADCVNSETNAIGIQLKTYITVEGNEIDSNKNDAGTSHSGTPKELSCSNNDMKINTNSDISINVSKMHDTNNILSDVNPDIDAVVCSDVDQEKTIPIIDQKTIHAVNSNGNKELTTCNYREHRRRNSRRKNHNDSNSLIKSSNIDNSPTTFSVTEGCFAANTNAVAYTGSKRNLHLNSDSTGKIGGSFNASRRQSLKQKAESRSVEASYSSRSSVKRINRDSSVTRQTLSSSAKIVANCSVGSAMSGSCRDVSGNGIVKKMQKTFDKTKKCLSSSNLGPRRLSVASGDTPRVRDRSADTRHTSDANCGNVPKNECDKIIPNPGQSVLLRNKRPSSLKIGKISSAQSVENVRRNSVRCPVDKPSSNGYKIPTNALSIAPQSADIDLSVKEISQNRFYSRMKSFTDMESFELDSSRISSGRTERDLELAVVEPFTQSRFQKAKRMFEAIDNGGGRGRRENYMSQTVSSRLRRSSKNISRELTSSDTTSKVEKTDASKTEVCDAVEVKCEFRSKGDQIYANISNDCTINTNDSEITSGTIGSIIDHDESVSVTTNNSCSLESPSEHDKSNDMNDVLNGSIDSKYSLVEKIEPVLTNIPKNCENHYANVEMSGLEDVGFTTVDGVNTPFQSDSACTETPVEDDFQKTSGIEGVCVSDNVKTFDSVSTEPEIENNVVILVDRCRNFGRNSGILDEHGVEDCEDKCTKVFSKDRSTNDEGDKMSDSLDTKNNYSIQKNEVLCKDVEERQTEIENGLNDVKSSIEIVHSLYWSDQVPKMSEENINFTALISKATDSLSNESKVRLEDSCNHEINVLRCDIKNTSESSTPISHTDFDQIFEGGLESGENMLKKDEKTTHEDESSYIKTEKHAEISTSSDKKVDVCDGGNRGYDVTVALLERRRALYERVRKCLSSSSIQFHSQTPQSDGAVDLVRSHSSLGTRNRVDPLASKPLSECREMLKRERDLRNSSRSLQTTTRDVCSTKDSSETIVGTMCDKKLEDEFDKLIYSIEARKNADVPILCSSENKFYDRVKFLRKSASMTAKPKRRQTTTTDIRKRIFTESLLKTFNEDFFTQNGRPRSLNLEIQRIDLSKCSRGDEVGSNGDNVDRETSISGNGRGVCDDRLSENDNEVTHEIYKRRRDDADNNNDKRSTCSNEACNGFKNRPFMNVLRRVDVSESINVTPKHEENVYENALIIAKNSSTIYNCKQGDAMSRDHPLSKPDKYRRLYENVEFNDSLASFGEKTKSDIFSSEGARHFGHGKTLEYDKIENNVLLCETNGVISKVDSGENFEKKCEFLDRVDDGARERFGGNYYNKPVVAQKPSFSILSKARWRKGLDEEGFLKSNGRAIEEKKLNSLAGSESSCDARNSCEESSGFVSEVSTDSSPVLDEDKGFTTENNCKNTIDIKAEEVGGSIAKWQSMTELCYKGMGDIDDIDIEFNSSSEDDSDFDGHVSRHAAVHQTRMDTKLEADPENVDIVNEERDYAENESDDNTVTVNGRLYPIKIHRSDASRNKSRSVLKTENVLLSNPSENCDDLLQPLTTFDKSEFFTRDGTIYDDEARKAKQNHDDFTWSKDEPRVLEPSDESCDSDDEILFVFDNQGRSCRVPLEYLKDDIRLSLCWSCGESFRSHAELCKHKIESLH